MEEVIDQPLNQWYLLSAYYVWSALTLHDNPLEVNRNILSSKTLCLALSWALRMANYLQAFTAQMEDKDL